MDTSVDRTFRPSILSQANSLLRNNAFFEAFDLYELIKTKSKELENQVQFNQKLTLKKIEKSSTLKNPQLIPLNELQKDDKAPEYWLSLGGDPYFQLDLKDQPLIDQGWYCFSLLIKTSNTKNLAKFYIDYGSGFSEENAIYLEYKNNKLSKKIFKLSSTVKSIRFDPTEVNERFQIVHLLIHRLEENIAYNYLTRQIWIAKKNANSLEEIKKTCKEESEDKNLPLIDSAFYLHSKLNEFLSKDQIYHDWIEDIEKHTLPDRNLVKTIIDDFKYKPKISIIIPTYNTDDKYLRECIDSVLSQSYPYWELCIADDASPKKHVQNTLNFYKKSDSRIKVVFREKNGHISKSSNSALELATGDFIALLDHDDLLPEHALFFVVEAINKNPEAAIFYSDEDKITEFGTRQDPHFKSDWNLDLFYSQNYVSHLGVYRKSLLDKINGFRTGVEGSQDQDLLLRCLPHIHSSQIIHIPRILYHWRILEGSTAMGSGEKSYTTDAGVRALTDYFKSINYKVMVTQGLVPNTYKISWPIPDNLPLVSLLIPTRDRRLLTETCVRSILEKSTYTNYEIIILDNGSVESDTLEFFEKIQQEDTRVCVIRYDYPFNYSAINNFGAKYAKGEIIGLINNDLEVISPDWLTEMVSHAIRSDVGCVGAKLYYSNDTIQHAGVICSIGGVAGHSHKHFPRNHYGYFSRLCLTQELSAVTAACLLVKKSIFDEVGGLDEENLKVAFNDVDFCLKVQAAGYRNIWTPYAELYHYESISRGTEDTPEKIERFNKEVSFMKIKWKKTLENDPFYNTNLTKDHENFSLSLKARS